MKNSSILQRNEMKKSFIHGEIFNIINYIQKMVEVIFDWWVKDIMQIACGNQSNMFIHCSEEEIKLLITLNLNYY